MATKKILLVDDEMEVLGLLQAIFDGLGAYRLLYARDGKGALKSARMDVPDIILLDMHLPDIDGYEVCRSVKSDPATSRIKVVILSGVAQDFDWRRAQEAGADRYIAKPFSPTALVDMVERLLMGSSPG